MEFKVQTPVSWEQKSEAKMGRCHQKIPKGVQSSFGESVDALFWWHMIDWLDNCMNKQGYQWAN